VNASRLLIVNADDFGLAPEVNAAVAAAFDRGIVRSASLLAGGVCAEEAARIAADRPGIGVGIHLAVTQVRPILGADRLPALTGGRDTFPAGPAALIRRLSAGNEIRREIVAEFSAQVCRAQDLGVRVTHLDSHQHVHLLPVVRSAFVEVAREFGIRAVRMPRLGGPSRSAAQWSKAAAIAAFGRAARAAFRGLTWTDGFRGLACSGELTRVRLLEVLRALPPGTHELMCHPASATALPEHAAWGYDGPGELAALCCPEAVAELRRRAIRLGNFADCDDHADRTS
jgi:hopanoid biosynthesis associated protein HpnK